MTIQVLILVYACILIISTMFAGSLWYVYRDNSLKITFQIWVSVIAGFLAQSWANAVDLNGFLAYSLNTITIILLLKLIKETSSAFLPLRRVAAFTVLGLIVSIILFLEGFSYQVSSIPFSAACSISLIFGALYNFKRTPLEIGFRALLLLLSLHYLDYPILRVKEEFAIVGFSMALVFTFCFSIIIPLFAMKKISDEYAHGLEDEVLARTAELKKAYDRLISLNTVLESTNVQLKEVSEEKAVLLNVLVHDLCNPVMVLEFAAETVQENAVSSKEIDTSARLFRGIATIKNTIAHVRAYHSAKRRPNDSAQTPVDLFQLVSELGTDFSDALKQKNLTLEIKQAEKSLFTVIAEEHRLKNQVLGNIISNAIKFSHFGGKIEIALNKSNNLISVQVRDYGVGIAKEKCADLFSLAPKNSTFGTHGEHGMGLGLSIVSHYLASMGGNIRLIDSQGSDQGSCFEMNFKPAALSPLRNETALKGQRRR